ncbi:hypothetical protein COO60DRAFT_131296 [Scenedesmus sp. NREL 46B-D3]|nr:hypothetical protein COO60DRAFT_131296 [Scenedesmus sp. NREL 46B-D3]
MVRIDTDSTGGLGGTTENVFGPLAVLVVGFLPEEYEAFRAMMVDIEADMVKVVPCTKALLGGTLQQAMEAEYPQYEQPPLGQRRALFLSGMYGSEVVVLIAAYREAGLPPCAFAAAVPNSWQRSVRELSEAVWRDQAAMRAPRCDGGSSDTKHDGPLRRPARLSTQPLGHEVSMAAQAPCLSLVCAPLVQREHGCEDAVFHELRCAMAGSWRS